MSRQRPPVKTPAAAQQSARPPKPLPPRQQAKPLIRPTDAVVKKYEDRAWKVITLPNGMGTDFIARKDTNLHFVQVSSDGDARAVGVAAGAFIQNAFSNAARPVRARVDGGKVTLIDANTNQRVVLRD